MTAKPLSQQSGYSLWFDRLNDVAGLTCSPMQGKAAVESMHADHAIYELLAWQSPFRQIYLHAILHEILLPDERTTDANCSSEQ